MKTSNIETIIGIDFGTTNSVVAVLENNAPRVIPNSEGNTKTPSVVSYMENGEILVGEFARRQSVIFPERTVTACKRLMGISLETARREGVDYLPYKLTEVAGQVAVQIGANVYKPAEIAAQILKKLKKAAEDYLGEPVSSAIITVPAYFDDCQRQDIVEAAKLAELDVLRLVNEPAAAALAYGLGHVGTERVVVLDFGGGTFDVTILDISNNVFEVKCSVGDSHLGGDDVDELLIRWMAKQFAEENGFELVKDSVVLRRLKDAAEKVKCELSVARQASVHLPFLVLHDNQPVNFECVLTRETFENIVHDKLQELLKITEKGLASVGLAPDDIDKIILVGGSMRIPLLQNMIEAYFQKPPFKGINPDEIVAMGAATQGGILEGHLREVVLLDVTPHSLGIEVENKAVSHVIEKNSIIPTRASKVFTTTRDDQELVQVHVVQGEGSTVQECRSLGNFVLDGIQKGPAGTARIEVTFAINANGMVDVTALDMITREERSVGVTVSPGESETHPGERQLTAEERRQKAAERVHDMMSEVIRADDHVPKEAAHHSRVLHVNEDGEFTSDDQLPAVSEIPTSVSELEPELEEQTPPPRRHLVPMSHTGRVVMTVPVSSGTSSRISSSVPPSAADASSPSRGSKYKPSPQMLKAMNYLQNNKVDQHSLNLYSRVISELRDAALQNPTREMLHAAVWMSCVLGQANESAELLQQYYEKNLIQNPDEFLALYNTHIQYFPDDINVLAARAQLLVRMGRPDEAVIDYEVVCSNSAECDPAHIKELIDLYEKNIELTNDSEVKFKLVRLFVRQKRFDDAINLLQPLSRSSTFREHASKVLALCFWQKGMYYLAWQRLLELKPSEDIKDMLYRLAKDMMSADQNINAMAVFRNLKEIDPNFRDVTHQLSVLENKLSNKDDKQGNRETEPSFRPTPAAAKKDVASSSGVVQNVSIMRALKDSRFTPIEEINHGSMGIVFRARDKVLDELVALKVLSDYLSHDIQAIEHFKREARAAKRLSHPNIVRIHDMYEINGKRLLSMEYIEGQDVKNLIAKHGKLPIDQVVSIFNGVCAALEYAHKMGIVHRDVKPANIMVCPSGLVKVTDLGIAKIMHNASTRDNTSTQAMGTPLYMSPEQVRGDSVDARTDIYSLGTTIYEMLMGNPPFFEGNIEYHHLYSRPRPLTKDVPPALCSIVFKCLEKDPAKRYQTVAELRQDLQQVAL